MKTDKGVLREIHSNIDLPQEKGDISNKQFNLHLKELERRNSPK